MKKILSVAIAGFLLSSSMCFAGLDEGFAAYKKKDYITAPKFYNLLAIHLTAV